jgi:hypothetical protein
MRLDGHHGAAGGFPADGAKRRCIVFSDLHAQGCALCVFVMTGSIGNFAAAQQTMVFMALINTAFAYPDSTCAVTPRLTFNKLMRIKPFLAQSGKMRPPC